MTTSEFDKTFPYLSQNEQDLLITALNSNIPSSKGTNGSRRSPTTNFSKSGASQSNTTSKQPTSLTNNDLYASPMQQAPGSGNFTDLGFQESPFLDYELDEGNFDWDLNGDQMIGSLPGASASADDDDEEHHDKRKSPGDNDVDEEEGGGKRREGDDKQSKKPGRKPLTSEPTSKRKAQNRAAQRAFRERKERHLKELETKVEGLEKASESANHENGLLRAQVDRLQTELKEYRKRLSATINNPNRPQLQMAGQPLSSRINWDINDNFDFEFPKFGTSPTTSRSTTIDTLYSINPSIRQSPKTMSPDVAGLVRDNSFSTTSPSSISEPRWTSDQSTTKGSATKRSDDLGGHFGVAANVPSFPGRTTSSHRTKSGSSENTHGASSGYNTASPSASSVSQNEPNSSCGTSPEPSADSPDHRKASDAAFNSFNDTTLLNTSGGEKEFCEQFQTACGNITNPIPPMFSQSNGSSDTSSLLKTPGVEFPSFDWMASQNGGAFDPVLFGDFRDPQDNIMNADFSSLFDESFPGQEFGSPMATPLEPALPRKKDILQTIENHQNGLRGEVVPGEEPKQFLTCNMLWDRVQRSARVQNGEADMDELCVQLKQKAKCSGSGAVIDQKDVDAILGPVPEDQPKDFLRMFH